MQSNEQSIYDAIAPHFHCDKRRTRFMAYLIVALLKLADSSLSQWSLAINQTTQRASGLKRLQRFLGQFRFSARIYAQLVWQRYGQTTEVVLTLDRTEYKQRGEWIQLLLIGIAHQGMSIPLLWHSANRRGNSPTIAPKTLLKLVKAWIQPRQDQHVYLTADREFIGPECRSCGLIPIIRIRANAQLTHQGQKLRVATLFDSPTWRSQPRLLYKQKLYLSGMRLADGDYLIIYSDPYIHHTHRLYSRRWQIETLFGGFKSRGFDLEGCGVTKHRRICKLLFVLSMSLIWALETGQWLIKAGKLIPLRTLSGKSQPLFSLFRHGLDELRDRVLRQQSIQELIPLLSRT